MGKLSMPEQLLATEQVEAYLNRSVACTPKIRVKTLKQAMLAYRNSQPIDCRELYRAAVCFGQLTYWQRHTIVKTYLEQNKSTE